MLGMSNTSVARPVVTAAVGVLSQDLTTEGREARGIEKDSDSLDWKNASTLRFTPSDT